MSYIKHNAIIITTNNLFVLSNTINSIESIGLSYIKYNTNVINGYNTIVIYPIGSGISFDSYEIDMVKRDELKQWLKSNRYEDGSSSLEWVEIEYGNDLDNANIVDHEWN